MTTEQPSIRCPKCFGENVEPRGDLWYCSDCKESFEAAGVQLPPPVRQAPPRPKRPPK